MTVYPGDGLETNSRPFPNGAGQRGSFVSKGGKKEVRSETGRRAETQRAKTETRKLALSGTAAKGVAGTVISSQQSQTKALSVGGWTSDVSDVTWYSIIRWCDRGRVIMPSEHRPYSSTIKLESEQPTFQTYSNFYILLLALTDNMDSRHAIRR